MRLLSEVGSAALEASVATAFLTAMVSMGLVSSYVAFTRIWISRSAYEGVICLSTDASEHECKQKTKSRIESVLPIGQVAELKMRKSKNAAFIEIRFELAGQFAIRAQEKRGLPFMFTGAIKP